MSRVLLVALGGALGSVARYGVGVAAPRVLGTGFPWGTLVVNLVGSFLISLVMHLSLTGTSISPGARLFLTTGVMGGFTTYSTFNYETLGYFRSGAWAIGGLNILCTVVVCLAAGMAGLALGRWIAPG